MELGRFVKREPILVISIILAFISLFLVPFNVVLSYDYSKIVKTICVLLCFLLIVMGLRECNVLGVMAQKLLSNRKETTSICLSLVLMTFFSAMFFTNDVALLTFVPFAIFILKTSHLEKSIPWVLVLQTMAANIGSSLTPFGNPHNLFVFNLHNVYDFSLLEYELALVPIVIAGAVLVIILSFFIKKESVGMVFNEDVCIEQKGRLYIMLVLMAIAIMAVLDLLPFYIVTVVVVAVFVLLFPKSMKKVDYSILLVFFFLFIFANGVTHIESISSALSDLMKWDPMITTVGLSQITSNVPSTILLEQFTDDWSALVVGADIGGFGTPIASMASIITLKLYLNEEGSSLKDYLKIFLPFNVLMLLVLIPVYYFISF